MCFRVIPAGIRSIQLIFFWMSANKKVYLRGRSATIMQCRSCGESKHISAFTQTVTNYCKSICNYCHTKKVATKKTASLTESKKAESDSPSCVNNLDSPTDVLLMSSASTGDSEPELTSRFDWLASNRFVVPYAKWIPVKSFLPNAGDIYVAKVISPSSPFVC